MGRPRKTPLVGTQGETCEEWAEADRQFQILTSYLMTGQSAEIYLDLIRDAYYGKREPQEKWEAAFLYSQGHTLESIGATKSVTRERVRQIVNSCHPAVNTRAINEARKLVEEREHDDLVRRVLDWSHEHPGAPGADGEQLFAVDSQELRRILGKRSPLHYPPRSSSRQSYKRWEDDELTQLIRWWWEENDDHSSESFERWSIQRGGPTRQTPMLRFGGWNRALECAGLETAYRSTRVRQTYSQDDIWASVIEFFSTPRTSYSFHAFEEEGQENPGRPSAALVRQRLKCSWNEMVRIAQLILAGNTEEFDSEWVNRVCEPRDWKQFRSSPVKSEKAREEVLHVLRRYMREHGEHIVSAEYAHWAQEHGEMSVMTMVRKSGLSWRELVQQVGATPGKRAGKRERSDRDVIDGVVAFLREDGPHTSMRYQAYAREHSLASLSTLDARYGKWSKVRDTARAILEREKGA